MKRCEVVINKSNDPMIKYLIELKAKAKSANSKYDGYGVWGNLNITDQGKGYVNAFLDAISDGTTAGMRKMRKAFWEGGLVVDGDGIGHVIRIGTLKVNSPKAELAVSFSGKKDSFGGQDKLIVGKFLLPAAAEEEDEWADEDEEDPTEDKRTPTAKAADAEEYEEEDEENLF